MPDESLSYEHEGELALCKGDDTAQASEQEQLQLQQQQAQYNSQLMGLMQTQFGSQQGVLSYLTSKMQPLIDNPTGYDQQTLTSMRTSADDNLSTQYQDAQKALNQEEFSNGSRDLPSGVNDQLNASLLNSEATDKANAQATITAQDAALQQQNKWNAVNVLSGVAAQDNPLGYASAATGEANAATSAGDSVANLSQANTAASGPTIGSILGGVTGGIFGAAGNAGGFKSLFGGTNTNG